MWHLVLQIQSNPFNQSYALSKRLVSGTFQTPQSFYSSSPKPQIHSNSVLVFVEWHIVVKFKTDSLTFTHDIKIHLSGPFLALIP